MVINHRRFAMDVPAILDNADEYGYGPIGDQGLMLRFYGPNAVNLTRLDIRFNYKPYWPFPANMSSVLIIHWHGLKPGVCLRCLLANRTLKHPATVCTTECHKYKQATLGIWPVYMRDQGQYMLWCMADWMQEMLMD